MLVFRYYLWRFLIKLTRKFKISMLVDKKVGIKNLNYNLLVTPPTSNTIISINPTELFLGPDFLVDQYTLLNRPLLESPHYELVEALSDNKDVKQTEYYRRYAKGTLDWRYLSNPKMVAHFYRKFVDSKNNVLNGTYEPIKIYKVGQVYYIYDGKHRAAMCALLKLSAKCEVVDLDAALGGVFTYLLKYTISKPKFGVHKLFYQSLISPTGFVNNNEN